MATAQPEASIKAMASTHPSIGSNGPSGLHAIVGLILGLTLLGLNKPIASIWRRTVSKVEFSANH
ncbi:hypothetical protein COMA1_11117 [Candidatus Nitrospira nitrosa]|uniref:Uncharacterized protein n=1 Tax=Candidatus Nitrospira nitrosa TaxID=1742972 RepID=A0A0S4L6N8_9BACT|nr:hypothetical protein COMA1_11117 [Candidatus Nitrospira nitrosa]